jgi:hypothetical protein
VSDKRQGDKTEDTKDTETPCRPVSCLGAWNVHADLAVQTRWYQLKKKMASTLAFTFFCGFTGGLGATFGAHQMRLNFDSEYRDALEGPWGDEQAQSLLPGAFVGVSVLNGFVTSFLCWLLAMSPLPVGACTTVGLAIMVYRVG